MCRGESTEGGAVTLSQAQVDEMHKAAGAFDTTVHQIEALRTKLNDHVATMLGQYWKGASANAFNDVHQAFDAEFRGVIHDLQNIHEKLIHTRAGYVKAEDDKQHAVRNKIGAQINHQL